MGMIVDPHDLLTGRLTNIVIRSTTGGWTAGSPGRPIFTLAGGAVGDTIADQVVLDPNTAVLQISSALANAILTIKDTINNEAVSLSVLGAAQFTAMGRTAVDNKSKVGDGKHHQTGR